MEIYSFTVILKKKPKLGLSILDQTQRNFKSNTDVKEYIFKLLRTVEVYTQKYGATLTMKRKFHDEDPIILHRIVMDKIIRSRVWKGKKYILFPEFTKNGILHYHCVIWDMYQTDYINMVQWWRRSFGFVKMELEIRHYKKWIDYITKDYNKTGLWTIYNDGKMNASERAESITT